MANDHQTLDRIYFEFKRSLEALGASVTHEENLCLASLVAKAMSNESRYFHSTAHVLNLIDSDEPILTLAALFHDLVYLQVDQRLPLLTEEILSSKIQLIGQELFLSEECLQTQTNLAIICDVFGFAPGHKLDPFKGLNEFLSAIVANEYLSPFLPPKILIQIFACIEATIPFRSTQNGEHPALSLEKTLHECNLKYGFEFEDSEVINIVKRAVCLANQDVQNFTTQDHSWFLATTWLLLPERNERLRGRLFTFKDYRMSLQKMESFFNFLSADVVFRQYRGFPETAQYDADRAAAAENIKISRSYLRGKLVAISLTEALAELTGGDLPISEFLGEVQRSNSQSVRMEDFLPPFKSAEQSDSIVLALLRNGRALETTFDLRNSPLAAFLYQQMGDEKMNSISLASEKFFNGEMQSADYLHLFPTQVLAAVVSACAQSCASRESELKDYLEKLRRKMSA